MQRVKIGRPLLDLVRLCYEADRPLLLVGPHGVGKSEGLEGAAREALERAGVQVSFRAGGSRVVPVAAHPTSASLVRVIRP